MLSAGTVTGRSRSPAVITTKAVITFAMLAIGTGVFASRDHNMVPVTPSASAAPGARTPCGSEFPHSNWPKGPGNWPMGSGER
ncbi:hypothetical protein JMUB6875_28810 [Nocardia sp. JMUB6875]